MNDYMKYINHVSNITINHSDFSNGMKILNECYELKQCGYQKAIGIAILGEARVGKTTLVGSFLSAHCAIETDTQSVCRSVLVTVPVKPSSNSLCEAILNALGDPIRLSRETEVSRRERVIKLIINTKVRVIVLDEVQHFVGRWTSTVMHDAADSLKLILDATNVMLVIAGLDYGKSLLHQNEQLAGRITRYIELKRFDWNDKHSRNQFRGLLKALQDEMKPFLLPDISSLELAFRFYISSGGLTGYVVNLLEIASQQAIFDKRFEINVDDFMRAHDTCCMNSARKFSMNPFNLEAEESTLNLLSETALSVGTAELVKKPKIRGRRSKSNLALEGIL